QAQDPARSRGPGPGHDRQVRRARELSHRREPVADAGAVEGPGELAQTVAAGRLANGPKWFPPPFSSNSPTWRVQVRRRERIRKRDVGGGAELKEDAIQSAQQEALCAYASSARFSLW